MKNCLRRQLRVLASAWWLPALLAAMALLMGRAASSVTAALLRRGAEPDPRSALALVLDMRSFFPLAGAVWAALFIGMDYTGGADSLAQGRGYSRLQLFGAKYLLFLLGCLAVSAVQQAFAVLTGAPGWHTLPASLLLRSFFLRLLLDAGMMVPPAAVCFLGRENTYIRLLGLLYGVALWRLMGSHYALWLQYAPWGREELLALWPAAALILGSAASAAAALREE